MKKYLIFFYLVFLISGCNKTKRNSNRLDGERWSVSELSVDGSLVQPIPELRFSECEIYKEDCSGTWYVEEKGHARFIWQVRDKGKTLIISNQADHAHTLEDIHAAEQCIAFSGSYTLTECRKNSIFAQTRNASGYPGKNVILKLKRIK